MKSPCSSVSISLEHPAGRFRKTDRFRRHSSVNFRRGRYVRGMILRNGSVQQKQIRPFAV